jgi:3-oxoacyl-(acyl-carrier-protein) synthase
MALDDSGLNITEENSSKVGVVLAHENMGMDHFYQKVIDELSLIGDKSAVRPSTKKGFLELFYKKFHRTGYELQTFMSLHHVAKVFDLHGFSLFINNACASGLFAIETAADAIRSGKCSQMVVAAVDHSSVFKQLWFNDINMRAKDGRIKPFALGRDGFTLGDGGAALVLEGMDSAIERKADIYAEYVAGSFFLEGWKVTYPDVTNRYYSKMIMNAIERAGAKPSDIDLLIPHGVGTSVTDKYEADAIGTVFGEYAKKPFVTALKPYFGHTLGSTAILETTVMLMAMRAGRIPPTLNCDKVDESLKVNILKEARSDIKIRFAVKTACGFAGFDGACVFKTV